MYNGHKSSETIAGRDATCVTIKASDYAGFAGLAGGKLGGDDVAHVVRRQADSAYLLKLAGTDASGKESQVLLATAAGPSSASDFVAARHTAVDASRPGSAFRRPDDRRSETDLPEAQTARRGELPRRLAVLRAQDAMMSPGRRLPRPTSTSVPTTERTSCQQNALPRIS